MTAAPAKRARPSFYVARTRLHDDPSEGRKAGEVGWVGPIRSEAQAKKEAAAWDSTGNFTAVVHPSTPEIRSAVRAWMKAVAERRQRASAR